MRKVRCSAGHYYDADKHASCPFCGMASNDAGAGAKTQPLDGGMQMGGGSMGGGSMGGGSTVGLDGGGGGQGSMSMGSGGGSGSMGMKTQALDGGGGMSAPSRSAGKTQALDGFAKQQKQSGKTVALGQVQNSSGSRMPVAGWLACVGGPAKGKSYEVLTRGNKIGRNMQYNINVSEDLSISREVNAEIVYDAINRKFYITPGTTNGLTSVNGALVLQPTILNEYDTVKVGKSEFMFIALCGERFSWGNENE